MTRDLCRPIRWLMNKAYDWEAGGVPVDYGGKFKGKLPLHMVNQIKQDLIERGVIPRDGKAHMIFRWKQDGHSFCLKLGHRTFGSDDRQLAIFTFESEAMNE